MSGDNQHSPVLDAVEGAAATLVKMASLFMPPFPLLRTPIDPAPDKEVMDPMLPITPILPNLRSMPARWEHRTGNDWFDRTFVITSIFNGDVRYPGVVSLLPNNRSVGTMTWSALNRHEIDEVIEALTRARDRAFPKTTK